MGAPYEVGGMYAKPSAKPKKSHASELAKEVTRG